MPEKLATQADARKPWRSVLKIHPAAELFPLMGEPELRELAEDIKRRGLYDPPSFYHDPKLGVCVLDGRNRLDALELIGWPADITSGRIIKVAETEPFDPIAFVLSKNVHRRHLTTEQKRDLIAKVLKAKPEASNLQIAKQVKVDDKTIEKVRRVLEARSEIPNVTKRTDTKGRAQPAGKPKKTVENRTPVIDMVRSRGNGDVNVWSAPQPEISIEQRKAEMAALDSAADSRTAADAKHEAAGKEVASGRALADFKFSCRTWLPKMTAEHRREAVAYCTDFAKPDAGSSETPTMAAAS